MIIIACFYIQQRLTQSTFVLFGFQKDENIPNCFLYWKTFNILILHEHLKIKSVRCLLSIYISNDIIPNYQLFLI